MSIGDLAWKIGGEWTHSTDAEAAMQRTTRFPAEPACERCRSRTPVRINGVLHCLGCFARIVDDDGNPVEELR